MTLDRKDYKSAIPQLEKRISAVENDTTKGLQGFDVLKAALEAEKLARKKAVLKVDEGIDLVTVKMFYALVDPDDYVGGLPPASTEWSETMPDITSADEGLVLWYKSKTLRNGVVVNETPPQQIQLMNGVFSFVNTVAGDSGWTTIDGGSITTGIIQASQGDSFFNLNDGTFKVYSSATGQGLVWNGSNLTINGSITLTGHSDSLATEISNLQSGVTSASQTATSYITYINATDGIKVHDSANSSSYTKLNSNGMQVYKGGKEVANFGDTATVGKSNDRHVKVESGGLYVYSNTDGAGNLVAQLGYGSGQTSTGGTATNPYYTLGQRATASGRTTIGNWSVAEGTDIQAAGHASHAEGSGCDATGHWSHAENLNNKANGNASFAGGNNCTAGGAGAMARGYNASARGDYQTALGVYNTLSGANGQRLGTDIAFMVGNGSGTGGNRHNAFHVTWNGKVYINDHVTEIGYIESVSGSASTADITAAASASKDLFSVSLTEGVWVVSCQARFTPSASGANYSAIDFSTTSQSTGWRDRRHSDGTYATQHNATTIVTVSGTQTYYLCGTATTAGTWNRANGNQCSITAVRIA